jgi:UDPglucose 6-dehydrogenase
MKKIVVIGAGYVGLVTAVCFASAGHSVVVVEKNESRVVALQLGQVPFYEPGLDNLLRLALGTGKIYFTTDIAEALSTAPEVVFCCVGTPSQRDGNVDLTDVWAVVVEVARNAQGRMLFVQKSTVPVGTCRKTEEMFASIFNTSAFLFDFDIASNPEFLREGCAINDFMKPDRVVFGVKSEWAKKILIELYEPFVQNKETQLLCMNYESSELTKYVSNTMLASRISFMNQIALLADVVGADIFAVEKGVGSDVRIGKHFLRAGIGYGGSCFKKDIQGLINLGRLHGVDMTFAQTVEEINENQVSAFISRISAYYDTSLSSRRCGILGVSFKPETDDIRCSPAVAVMNALVEKTQSVMVYDPVALPSLKLSYPQLQVVYAKSIKEILRNCDFLVICTEWTAFAALTPADLLQISDKVVFDGRNMFDPYEMAAAGITYYPVGRKSVSPKNISAILNERQLEY